MPSPGFRETRSYIKIVAPVVVTAAVGIVGLLLWNNRSRGTRSSAFPQTASPPVFASPTLPLPPPSDLTAGTVDEFIRWTAAVPVSEVQQIRDAVAKARGDDAVHAALIDRLFSLPAPDFGQHLITLSIIGELGRPDSADHLIRFVHLPSSEVIPIPPREQSGGLQTSFLEYGAALQARAVEMLTHLGSQHALDATLHAAFAHPSRAVRIAALDAFTYHHNDSPDAVSRARAAARPTEAKLVGLPRRSRDGNPADFDAQVADFYRRYPTEVPPQPHSHPLRRVAQKAAPTAKRLQQQTQY
jgi:hypothetical protein